MRTLGIDVGGTSVKAALLVGGRVAALARSRPYARPDRATLERALRDAVGEFGPGLGLSALGMCVPGVYDPASRRITASANVPGLVGPTLEELLEGAGVEGARPAVVTDTHAAAHDVWARDSRPGRLLAIALGTGVGACVLDDGQPLRVSGNSPGHMGQWDVSLDARAPIGPDGGRGGLEAYIGLPALRTRYGAHWVDGLSPESDAVRALARAIRLAHAMYRPHRILLLGGVGLALRPLLGALETQVRTALTTLARPECRIAIGSSPFHAACGAARLAADAAFGPKNHT